MLSTAPTLDGRTATGEALEEWPSGLWRRS